MAETLAQAVAPMIQRRNYIDVAAYVSATDTENAHAGIQAALNAGYGREVVFTAPYAGTRVYALTDRADGRLYMPRKCRIIFDHGAKMKVYWAVTTGNVGQPVLYAGGDRGPYRSCSAASRGDTTVTVGAGLGVHFSAGWAYITSDDDFTKEEGLIGKKGEDVYISSVSGDVLTLGAPLVDTYTTNPTIAMAVELVDIEIVNPQIEGPGRLSDTLVGNPGDRGIYIVNGGRVAITGGEIVRCDMHSAHVHARHFSISDLTAIIDPLGGAGERTQYPIAAANGSQRGSVSNCYMSGGREGFSQTSSGTTMGPTRNVRVEGNTIHGARRSAITTHDNWEGFTIAGNDFENCEQFIDLRGRRGTVVNNRGRGAGAFTGSLDCAVQLGSGVGEIHANGNVWEDVLRGWWMPPSIEHEVAPGDITITEDRIRSDRAAYGALFDYRGSATPGYAADSDTLGTLFMRDLDYQIATNTFARGVETVGKWTNPHIDGRFVGGASITAPNPCVYMHGTPLGGAGYGPISPDIVGVMFNDKFTAPLVQHATGVTKTRYRGIGHTPAGEVI